MASSRKKSKRLSADELAILELVQDLEILWRIEEVDRLISTVRRSGIRGTGGNASSMTWDGWPRRKSDVQAAKRTLSIVS